MMKIVPSYRNVVPTSLELFDNKNIPPKLNLKDDDLPNKKINEIKEVSLQLLTCWEMFSSPTTISTKPPPLIANTIVTALNKEREKRQLSLIVHNLSESTATEGETRKNTTLTL